MEFSSEKRSVSDFAVWKYVKPDEDHAMQWEFNGKMGYPGWHLECSTIIHEELGETIDIHTGGIDHIPIHHTNEIAQSEAAFGKKMCNFWLHCNFITIDGQKVSKSLGNVYTLADLAKRSFTPLDFKLWVLQGHYRGDRNFSFEDLAAAKNRRLNWRNRIASAYQIAPEANFNQKEALDLVSDDLNSSKLLAYIDEHTLSLDDWTFLDQLLGLDLLKSAPEISTALQEKITARKTARKNKDFATSDKFRDELAAENITVLDTKNGPIWQYLT